MRTTTLIPALYRSTSLFKPRGFWYPPIRRMGAECCAESRYNKEEPWKKAWLRHNPQHPRLVRQCKSTHPSIVRATNTRRTTTEWQGRKPQRHLYHHRTAEEVMMFLYLGAKHGCPACLPPSRPPNKRTQVSQVGAGRETDWRTLTLHASKPPSMSIEARSE